jgi:hypothetical protein
MLALAAVTATVCLAVPEKSEFERYLFAATELFEKLEFERAYEQLQKAKAKSRGVKDDVVVSVYEGVLKAELTGFADAEAAFRTALLLDPDAALPVKVSPSVRELFERVKADARLAHAKHGPPPPAEVEVEPPPPAPPSGGRRAWPLVTGLVGAAVIGGTGGALWGLAFRNAGRLAGEGPMLAGADAEALAAQGRLFEASGLALFGVAGAAALLGVVGWLVSGPGEVSVSPAVSPGGAGVVFGGAF